MTALEILQRWNVDASPDKRFLLLLYAAKKGLTTDDLTWMDNKLREIVVELGLMDLVLQDKVHAKLIEGRSGHHDDDFVFQRVE